MSTGAIVGLGKIGLPLAVQCLIKGKEVYGCDIQQKVVDAINKGINPIKEEPGLEEHIKKRQMRATTDTVSAVKKSDVVIIVVPLVVDEKKNIDFKIIDAATKSVAEGLHKGCLVIFETTLPVGTTRNRLAKILEESGLKAGKDFYVAFSPERVYSGRVLKDLATYPKIVGGLDEKSTKRAESFYGSILHTYKKSILTMSAEEAEFSKLIGMTYRDATIALSNEFAKFADEHGLDIMKTIEASNSEPFSHILIPGIGVGGHCAPVYPYFLIHQSKNIQIPGIARKENDGMAEWYIQKLEKAYGNIAGKKVLIIGLAYRPNVKEDAFSSTKLIIEALKKRKAGIFIFDPLFSKEEIEKFGVHHAPDLYGDYELIISQSIHDASKPIDWKRLSSHCKVFVDGRNEFSREEIEKNGMQYVGVGRI